MWVRSQNIVVSLFVTVVLLANPTGSSGVQYNPNYDNFWSYIPGDIKYHSDYQRPISVEQLVAGGIHPQEGGERELVKNTYVIEEDGVKKIVEEEIETVKLPPAGSGIKTAQNVEIGLVPQARAIKLYHYPVVSDREKKKIESMDRKNIFSFLGCFGGRKEAFF